MLALAGPQPESVDPWKRTVFTVEYGRPSVCCG